MIREQLTNYSPYVDINSSNKSPSSKYKYQVHPSLVNRSTGVSQFSPYKQTYHPHKQNIPFDSINSFNRIPQFSPYKKENPVENSFDLLEQKQIGLIDILKETDFKAIQHTAMTRQHIIQQLTLINHQLKDEVAYYKHMVLKLEEELDIGGMGRERGRGEYEKIIEENFKQGETITKMKEQIKLLVYKNTILEKEYQFSASKLKEKTNREKKRKEEESYRDKSIEKQRNTLKQIEEIINRQYSNNRYLSEFICCKRDMKGNVSCIMKRLSRLQSFARSIFDVRGKVDKQKDNDLKKTWRWIKYMIEQALRYRKLKQYEGQISRKLGLKKKNIEDLLIDFIQR